MSDRVTIYQEDVIRWCEAYEGPKFHALLADCPYHLTSITERFGKPNSAPVKLKKIPGQSGSPYARGATGFMGQQWDGGDIAFRPETWAALAKHLYPGAFVMAFAGTRGYHRMACAMEDAGLILHPLMIWIAGSGFPKATRVDTQIDKAAGAEREPEREWKGGQRSGGIMGQNNGTQKRTITAAATDLARAWAGHRYGLQALKPALECVAVAQVPYRGRPVDCITRTGAGSLNVDGARVSVSMADRQSSSKSTKGPTQHINNHAKHDYEPVEYHAQGRWPSNLILDDSPEVAAMFPQTQTHGTGNQSPLEASTKTGNGGMFGVRGGGEKYQTDEGSAARFFFQSDWSYEVFEQIEQADPGVYVAKAGRREREIGLLGQVPCLVCGELFTETHISKSGRQEECRRSNHPTVKPLRLTRHLATLLLPPAAYAPRRLLQPFSGSGSEAIGAALAGWEEVCGIEQSPEYCKLAEARAAWWSGHVGLFEEITAEGEAVEAQGELPL